MRGDIFLASIHQSMDAHQGVLVPKKVLIRKKSLWSLGGTYQMACDTVSDRCRAGGTNYYFDGNNMHIACHQRKHPYYARRDGVSILRRI